MIIETNIAEPIQNALDEKIFHQIKASLRNSNGVTYTAFKKNIQPHFLKIWVDILSGWILLILCLVIGFYAINSVDNKILKTAIALLDAALLGLIISYLINFFHEAAHYNIATNKLYNDIAANVFLGVLQAQGIKQYRIIHWQHHIHHGSTGDTEHSYFEALTFRFLIESLTGIRAIKIFLFRSKKAALETANKNLASAKKEGIYMLVAGVVFHTVAILSFFLLQQYWLLAIWLLGFGTFFPFFGSLRQLLEHRADWAEQKINYGQIPHGKVNRIFKTDLFSSVLGSAGFTRHLLHHLEPQISYTNLKQVEAFLLDTSIAPQVKRHRTTYYKAFVKLFGK